jgi:hypothetical protein
VNCQDIVTLVPPEIALRHYFRHVGIEEYFDRHGVLHEHPSELMKAADVVPGVLDHDGAALLKEITNPLDFLTQCLKGNLVNPPAFLIGNHSPARYPILIWNYYTAA